MSLLNKIEELRNKPEDYRKKIVTIAVTAGMVLVFMIWLASFRAKMTNRNETSSEAEADYAPMEMLKTGVDDIVSSAREKFGKIFDSTTVVESDANETQK